MDASSVERAKTCRKCEKVKSLSEFAKKTKPDGSHGGYAHACKACVAAHWAEQRRRDDLVASGNHECSRCRLVKPLSEFFVNRQASRGVTTYCRECSKLAKRKSTDAAKKFHNDRALAADGMKRCPRCATVKSRDAFHAHAGGRMSYCKECQNEDIRLRARRPEGMRRIASYRARPYVMIAEKKRRTRYAMDPANREKILARKAVYKAIKRGALTRSPCQECGAANADAHHHNGYDREHRLDVEWLCRSCHLRHHRAS